MKQKQVVAGLGEIGNPIFQLLLKNMDTIGYDLNESLIDRKSLEEYGHLQTSFLHICIPFTSNFIKNIKNLYIKFKPKIIVIHSTVSPYTTQKIQQLLPIPIIYSATRGVHKRMLYDLKRYTKFFGVYHDAPRAKWAISEYSKLMKKCNVRTKQMSNPLTLELAKIVVDTSYYGWLINYAQLSNIIAIENKVDYDEMWSFSDEIHKFLGNRPKMYPGLIGGHCVIPNLDLIHNETLDLIKKINDIYARRIIQKKAKKK